MAVKDHSSTVNWVVKDHSFSAFELFQEVVLDGNNKNYMQLLSLPLGGQGPFLDCN
jgi:hypothetical protein